MAPDNREVSRRHFLASGLGVSALLLMGNRLLAEAEKTATGPACLDFSHFPDAVHASIWRNWGLVPLENLAAALNLEVARVKIIARSLGLPSDQPISPVHLQRNYLCIIRRNWHLLPKDRIIRLLGWTPEKLEFTLREDDFFYIKLGSLKPECSAPALNGDERETSEKTGWIKRVLAEEFPSGFPQYVEEPFHFITELTTPIEKAEPTESRFSPRFSYSYFAPFGDPLIDEKAAPYPDNYLDRMAQTGMDGAWLHIVLSKLTPFPWDDKASEGWQKRLDNLASLVERARARGIGIYLYLNEPRFQPLAFFEKHPDLKGVTIGDHAALCTSHPAVQDYLASSIARIVRAVPHLAGFFSITASENHTNCWSHSKGAECPRCGPRGMVEVVTELNALYRRGIDEGLKNHSAQTKDSSSGSGPQLIVWDWGWPADVADAIIQKLPTESWFMTVSEWDMEIQRGGVRSKVGEYSLSVVGPGERAIHRWKIAREAGLKTIAKIQAGTTWEIGSVPYVPAVENAATHAWRLRQNNVDGLMLNWSLGGYPSPNLEVVAAIGHKGNPSPEQAMLSVASRRFGQAAAAAVVRSWQKYSAAFSQFPYHVGVVYNAPVHAGASNLLWQRPTGYKATMVGLPYDDLTRWRAAYPADVFVRQLRLVADGFMATLRQLREETSGVKFTESERRELDRECYVAEAVAIHYGSAANQAEFVLLREDAVGNDARLRKILQDEILLAKRMIDLQAHDSRLGFEASNQYFYLLPDLVEKVLNCRHLLEKISLAPA